MNSSKNNLTPKLFTLNKTPKPNLKNLGEPLLLLIKLKKILLLFIVTIFQISLGVGREWAGSGPGVAREWPGSGQDYFLAFCEKKRNLKFLKSFESFLNFSI